MSRIKLLVTFVLLVSLSTSCLFLPPPPNGQGFSPPPNKQGAPPPNNPGFQPPSNNQEQSIPPTSASNSGCPSDKFFDASAQSNVQLRVSCNGDSLVVETNNIPNFQVPGQTDPEYRTWYIPLNSQTGSQPTTLPLGGPVAVAVNGVQIHGPNGADFDGYPDPVYAKLVVACGGHHANRTIFHFHGRPDCLFGMLVPNANDTAKLVGVVLGYAFDGYPILSPYICDKGDCANVRKVTSSWSRVKNATNAWEANEFSAGSGDLDQCNGMVGADGAYAYYSTDTFPYNLGCYRGIPDQRNIPPAR